MNETKTNEFKDRVTINAVLAFTAYGLDTGSDANVQKILNETFSLEEVKSARTTLWELCHEGYLPAMKNRQTTARRSEQQAIVCDIVEWLQILTELDKRPCLVVNVSGLARIPKFQIEEINETALCEKMVRMETKITSMNAMFLQHIVDADAEMKRINDSVEQQSVEVVMLKDMRIPSDNKSQRDVNGTHNDMVISESNTASETVKKTPGLSEIVTSRDTSKSVMVAEDIPEILETTATISNPISAKQTVKSYSDTVRADDKFQQVKRKSRVVYGKSTKNTLRAAPEVQFDACISGVDSVYKEEDLENFLNEHKIVYASVQCY